MSEEDKKENAEEALPKEAETAEAAETDDMSMEDFAIQAGTPLPKGAKIATRAELLPLLEEVVDPEIYMSIIDLGLLYGFEIKDNGDIDIEMTVTAAGCPFAEEMPLMVADALSKAENVGIVSVKMVWQPEWNMDMLSDKAKLEFDLGS